MDHTAKILFSNANRTSAARSIFMMRNFNVSKRAAGIRVFTRPGPDMPTVVESLPGYEGSGVYGVVAPRSTPTEVIATLNKEINAVLTDTKFKARLAELDGTPLPGTPTDFGTLIANEIEKRAKVVKLAGIKAE